MTSSNTELFLQYSDIKKGGTEESFFRQSNVFS